MSARRQYRWVSLSWPREVDEKALISGLSVLHGLSRSDRRGPIILEAEGQGGRVIHRLRLGQGQAVMAIQQLERAIPGLQTDGIPEQPPLELDLAIGVRLTSLTRPMAVERLGQVSNAVLTALAGCGNDERLLLQLLLGPRRSPLESTTASGLEVPQGPVGLLRQVAGVSPQQSSESRRATATKHRLPGWRCDVRLAVQADTSGRRHQLLSQLLSALRGLEAPGVRLKSRRISVAGVCRRALPWRLPLALNIEEVAGLCAWPVGDSTVLPVVSVTSRRLPVPREVARRGLVLAESNAPGKPRPLAVSRRDALSHLHVIGATGSGKSVLLLNLAVQAMASGDSLVLIEPKGDLVRDLLGRIPEQRRDDVVVIDPTDSAPVGLNPLSSQGGGSGEVAADQLLAVFKGMFGEALGPRSTDVLHAGLLTLVSKQGASLALLPGLLSDASLRRRWTSGLDDRVGLEPFWGWYEQLSAAQRSAVIGPLMNKLRPFLLRRSVRRVIGQAEPRFELESVFTEPRVVVVSLAKGQLGPAAANLLGSLLLSQLWQAALGRSRVPADKRRPVWLVMDEFQDYLHLSTDLAEVLQQARGMGLGVILAHQHLGQLSASMRSALLANARSRVVFQTSYEDAAVLVKGDARLEPADVVGLGAYEAYLRLMAGGVARSYTSGRTLPPPEPTSDPWTLRAASRKRWGVPAAAVDAALDAALVGQSTEEPADLGPIGRRPKRPSSGGQTS